MASIEISGGPIRIARRRNRGRERGVPMLWVFGVGWIGGVGGGGRIDDGGGRGVWVGACG